LGSQISVSAALSVDVIVGRSPLRAADDHVHLGGWTCPPHAVLTREVTGFTPARLT
jgi:hypothetical protein